MYYNADGNIGMESDIPEVATQSGNRRGRTVSREKVVKAKREIEKKVRTRKVKGNTPLQRYANAYIKNKDVLFPLMAEAMGEPLPKDANHGELVALYIHLLKTNEEFASKIRAMTNNEAVEMYSESDGETLNAVDPYTAIAESVGQVAGAIGDISSAKTEQQMQEDAMLYSAILQGQKKDDTTKILLISGISLVAVGVLIYVVSKKK